MVQCVACKNFTLRGNCRSSIGMASQGYGTCRYGQIGRFYSATFPLRCEKFSPAGPEVEEKRLVWLKKQEMESLKRIEKWR